MFLCLIVLLSDFQLVLFSTLRICVCLCVYGCVFPVLCICVCVCVCVMCTYVFVFLLVDSLPPSKVCIRRKFMIKTMLVLHR